MHTFSFTPKHYTQQGHSYCKQNPALEETAGLIPLDLDRIPDVLQVVLLAWKKDKEGALQQIRSSKCFHIRGKYCMALVHRQMDVSGSYTCFHSYTHPHP